MTATKLGLAAGLALGLSALDADAIPVSLAGVNQPDINISFNNAPLSYDATSGVFELTSLFGVPPVATADAVTGADGQQRAASNLQIAISATLQPGADASEPVVVLGGSLTITGNIETDNIPGGDLAASGTLLEGTLLEAGNDDATIQLLWMITGGSFASEYANDLALSLIAGTAFDPNGGFAQSFGANGFEVSTDTQGVLAAIVPIGPTLPLMLTALLPLLAIRRRPA